MYKRQELILRSEPKFIFIFLAIMLFIIISFICISVFYKYNKYYYLVGLKVTEGSDNYVQTFICNDRMDIIKNYDLYINKEKISFDYEVGSEMYEENNKIYREVKIRFSNIKDDILDLTFVSSKTTFFLELRKLIRKGME